MRKKKRIGFVLFFCLASFYFCFPVAIDPNALKILFGGFALLLIIAWIRVAKRKVYPPPVLDPWVKLLVFAIFFSAVPAWISHDQSPSTTIVVLVQYTAYFLYFYLLKKNYPVDAIERAAINLGLIAACMYFVGLALFPHIVFGNMTEDEVNTQRGLARIPIAGFGFIYLAYFLTLNKFVVYRKRKMLVLAGFLLLCICATLARQVIAVCLLLGLNFLMSRRKLLPRLIILGVIGTVLIVVLPNISYVQKLIEQTQSDQQDYRDNVRVLSGTYFLTVFSPDALSRVFGNGEPAMKKSNYGKEAQRLKDDFGFYTSDVGFVGTYAKFGILFILAWVVLSIKSFRARMPRDKVYGKYFIAFILLTGLSSSTSDNFNFMAAIAMCFFLIEKGIAECSP